MVLITKYALYSDELLRFPIVTSFSTLLFMSILSAAITWATDGAASDDSFAKKNTLPFTRVLIFALALLAFISVIYG